VVAAAVAAGALADVARVFNDLICNFTKSDFKSFSEDFMRLKINLKNGDLIGDLILRKYYKIKIIDILNRFNKFTT
jgi:hypothetical protein